MLDLAGVPLHAAERDGGDPIVLGGGPAVANPWPLAPFFDAFFIGEVEDQLGAIVAAMERTAARRACERSRPSPACGCPGASAAPAERQVFMGFSAADAGAAARSCRCSRRCTTASSSRSCAAAPPAAASARPACGTGRCASGRSTWSSRPPTGCWTRPAATRSRCSRSARATTAASPRRSRASASCGPACASRCPRCASTPRRRSLAGFAADQRGSVTLAPEAGSQELRDAINKGVDEAQFEEAVRATFQGGFTGLKLYFMIGLPGETDDDVLGIARMAGTAARLAKEIGSGPGAALRGRLVLRAQGAHAVRARAVRRRADAAPPPAARARGGAAGRARRVPRRRRLDGRGDAGARRVRAPTALVEEAWRPGRGSTAGASTSTCAAGRRPRPPRGVAPRRGRPWRRASWRDAVDARLDDAFLAEELERAARGELTEDCRDGDCARLRRVRRRDRHGPGRMSWWLSPSRAGAGAVPVAPGHGARGAAHVRARRRAHRAVAGHAAQAAALAAAAAAGGRGGRARARRGRGARGRRAGDGGAQGAARREPAGLRADGDRGRRRGSSAAAGAGGGVHVRARRRRRRDRRGRRTLSRRREMRSASA